MLSIQPQDFRALSYPSDLKLSPDGRFCAWLEHMADPAGNSYQAQIVVSPSGCSSPRYVAAAQKPSHLSWGADGRLLYLCAGPDGAEIRSLNPASGEDLPEAQLPFPTQNFYPAGKWGYVVLAVENFRPSVTEEADVFDEIPFWANGRGITNGKRTRLYLWQEGRITPISPQDSEIGICTVSPDEVLYTLRPRIDKKMKFAALRRYDLSLGTTSELIGPDRYDIFHVCRLGGRVLVCATDMAIWGNVQNPDFFWAESEGLIPLAAPDLGVTNDVTSDARYGSCGQWAVCGQKLLFIAVTRRGSRMYALDCTGGISPLTPDDGRAIAGLDAAGGRIAWVEETPLRSGEIFCGQTPGQGLRLSSANDGYFHSHRVLPPESFTFRTSSGEEIDGYVIIPADFDPTGSYPGVLQIHGGPKLAYGGIFHLEMQAMAARGWFVLFCNPHGSDGRGSSFMDLRGIYGTSDYRDLMEFTDEALRRFPQLDGTRLAACGGSYGGFMVNWIIGHTHRFCCAISQRCISNWISMFNTGDTGYRFVADQLDGTPWSAQQRFIGQSPVMYADRVRTPTLFIHADQDYRCPMGEGLQMFTALRYFGIEARMCLIHGENHELSRAGRPHQRLRRLTELFEWLDRYLR